MKESLELWISPEEEGYIQRFLKREWVAPSQILIGMVISGGWETKTWQIQSFSRLAERLMKDCRARILMIGEEKDKQKGERIQSLVKERLINAIGKTNLEQLVCLIKRCRVLITPDSATMHIAAAVGTPFVALFGPTDPSSHLPPAKRFKVIRKTIACSPCYRHRCLTKKCMRAIKVEEVVEAVKEMLVDEQRVYS